MESNHFAGGAYAMNPPLATLPPLHHCRYYFLSDFIVARQPQALMSCINTAQVLACDQAFSSILSGAFH